MATLIWRLIDLVNLSGSVAEVSEDRLVNFCIYVGYRYSVQLAIYMSGAYIAWWPYTINIYEYRLVAL
jgi:hypothetical protein